MRDAKLISTGDVKITDIDAGDRLRPVSVAAVEGLVASINELGRMKDEIHLRKAREKNAPLVLIAGGHRLAAAKILGWETIPAKVWDCSNDWAVLLEIDDNLAQAKLSALELAIFLSRKKAVYERLRPETKAGMAGALARRRGGKHILMDKINRYDDHPSGRNFAGVQF